MTRAPFFLFITAALSACTPTSEGGDPPPVAETQTAAVHCATEAWDDGDTRPVAVELTVDLATGDAALGFDRAHEYGSDDPFEFEGRTWSTSVVIDAGADLAIDGDDLTVVAASTDLGAGLWTGTLTSDTYGTRSVVCWEDTFVAPHSYDPQTGDCLDADGNAGFDALPVPYVRASGDGQCGTFEGLSLNEDFLGYPILRGTDLRGARLAGATLFFASIHDGRFEGADMTGFEFGYAEITASADAHTVWPSDNCSVDGDAMECFR